MSYDDKMGSVTERHRIAILFSHLDWRADQRIFPIVDGLEFQSLKRSPIKALYRRLCSDRFFHDGEPQEVLSAFLMDDVILNEISVDYHSPDSVISKVCNCLALCLRYPVTNYCMIGSNDNFQTHTFPPLELHAHYDLYELLGHTLDYTEEINRHLKTINRSYDVNGYFLNDKRLEEIKKCYAYYTNTSNRIVSNAFRFFFSAWHSRQMEHTCINLAIVLESLFSPSGRDELTHRIAFNTCHFLGTNSSERECIFDLLKRFYSLRSTIIHGGVPKHQELYVLTGVVYLLCAESLTILGTDESVAAKFASEESRNAWFKSWLF